MFHRKKVENLPEAVVHKWSPSIAEEGFVPFPKRLLRCLGQVFDDPQMQLLQAVLAVVDYRRPKLVHPPSRDYLAFISGLAPQRFADCMAELKRRGLVEIELDHEDAMLVTIHGLLQKVEALTPDQES